jgi:hypothetical protein
VLDWRQKSSVFVPRFTAFGVCGILLIVMSVSVFENRSILKAAGLSPSSVSFASSFLPSPKPPIPSTIFIMSSLQTTSSSLSLSASSAGRGDFFVDSVAGHVGGNGLSPEPGSTVVAPIEVDEAQSTPVHSVWDCEHIQRTGTTSKDQYWKCLWCNQSFKYWNRTKALYHLAKVGGHDVRICRATHDPASKALYKSMLKEKESTLSDFNAREQNFQAIVEDGQRRLTEMFTMSRQRVSNAGGPPTVSSTGTAQPPPFLNQQVLNCNVGVEASTSSQLTMAIADFIHSTGLSFSATQGEYFHNILRLARGASASYKPPGRNALSTSLLKINYNRRMER